MFPGEGPIYVWTNKAFGPFLGFFAGFCAWWPGVLVMIATGDAVVSLISQLNSNWLQQPWQQGLVIILVIAFSLLLSVLRFRVTQNYVNIIFVAYGGAIVLVQSIISSVFTAIAFILAPLVTNALSPTNLSTVIYDILQAAVTVIWCVSMVILFVDVIIIRFKFHETFARIRLAPDWVFYLCALIGAVATGYGVYATFTGPWTPLLSQTQWVIWIGGIAVISLIIAVVVFFVGQATIKGEVSDEEIIAQVTGAAGGE